MRYWTFRFSNTCCKGVTGESGRSYSFCPLRRAAFTSSMSEARKLDREILVAWGSSRLSQRDTSKIKLHACSRLCIPTARWANWFLAHCILKSKVKSEFLLHHDTELATNDLQGLGCRLFRLRNISGCNLGLPNLPNALLTIQQTNK